MQVYRTLLLWIFLIIPGVLAAQSGQSEKFVLLVKKASSAMKIDGDLSESSWSEAENASPFLNKWPSDSGYASVKTEVKMTFNDQFLFVAAINYQSRDSLTIQTLKRDQIDQFWNSDGFSVILDPINQKANGFMFAVNAGGAQLEGAVNNMGSWSQINENWDNKWFSSVTVHDRYWIVEMAIPFTSLRFKDGVMEWGLNFIRNDMKGNTFSTWTHVPLQFNGQDLGYLGTLRWAEPIKPEKSRVTLIPYVSGGKTRNHEDGEKAETPLNAGFDAKLALTSSLNLDLTVKPDFSNVEVDRQMTNVTRFSLLFPERRNFFLENADLFSGFGSWMVKPFFSRTIGLYDGEPVPILAGARLSGNVTKGLRIGIMDVQTEATDEVSANNYFVTSLSQRIFSRSAIKFLTTNRQTTERNEGETESTYNRTYGGEFQYTSDNGNFTAYLRGHTAITPEKLNENEYLSAQAGYINKKFYIGSIVEQVGENYINDVGFIPRLYNYDAVRDTTIRIGHYNINPWLGFLIYPKKSKVINLIEPNTWSVINYKTNGDFLERFTSVNLGIYFKDTRILFLDVFNNEVQLPFPCDLLDNDKPIPAAYYNFTQYKIKYTTDARRPIYADFAVTYGNFYNGTRAEYGVTLNARKQPWGNFGISYLQNVIELPDEYGSDNIYLIGPRAELSLRNNIWWTTFLQYNTQAENVNINSRLQWRFKPMSDVFLVYTDNYATTTMNVKNRGLVFKITYWLNM
ncbi:MAG TPA: DUF5916 domain-containing protein [Ohtaekwangia sp.]